MEGNPYEPPQQDNGRGNNVDLAQARRFAYRVALLIGAVGIPLLFFLLNLPTQALHHERAQFGSDIEGFRLLLQLCTVAWLAGMFLYVFHERLKQTTCFMRRAILSMCWAAFLIAVLLLWGNYIVTV